mgnify:CR=1 FL=1
MEDNNIVSGYHPKQINAGDPPVNGAGFFNKTLNIKGIFFPVFLGAVFTLSKALVVHVISAFYPNISVSYRIFSSSFGFELLFNSLLAPVIFRFLDVFKDYLILTPEKVS